MDTSKPTRHFDERPLAALTDSSGSLACHLDIEVLTICSKRINVGITIFDLDQSTRRRIERSTLPVSGGKSANMYA